MDLNSQAAVQSKLASIFMGILFLGMNSMMGIIPMLLEERPLIYRETIMKMYDSTAYVLAMLLVELPYTIFFGLLFTTIFYPMVNMSHNIGDVAFFILVILSWLFFCAITGFMFSYLSPNLQIAMMVASIIINIWNILAGFLIPKPSLNYPWKLVWYIDPTQYVLQSIVSTEFFCEGPNCPTITVPRENGLVTLSIHGYIRDNLGMDYTARWYWMMGLWFYTIGFLIITLIVAKYIRYLNR